MNESKEETIWLRVSLPREIHTALKVEAATRGTSMRLLLIDMVKELKSYREVKASSIKIGTLV